MIKSHLWKTWHVVVILGLLGIIVSCISTFSDHASKRLRTLEMHRNALPVVMGSELIKVEERIIRSHVPKCARVQILQLYGTNSKTLDEILQYYKSHLDQNTWNIERDSEDGIAFVESNGIELGVSFSVEWPLEFSQEAQKQVKNFDILFLVSLGGFVDPNITVKECT